MKSYVLLPAIVRYFRGLIALAFFWLLISSVALGEDWLTQGVDATWNLHDTLQETVRKSVRGYIDAVKEAPPPDNGGKPFDLPYLEQLKQNNEKAYNHLKNLKDAQQKLLQVDTKLLQQLPPNDPKRAEIEDERKKVANGIGETIKKRDQYKDALAESNHSIDRWKYGHGLTNEPPKPLKKKPPPEPVQTGGTDDPGSSGPSGPTGPGPYTGGGGPTGPAGPVTTGGGNIDAWKAKEAEIENKARNLGKEREQAVIDYLNNPTPENKAKAAAIKQKLDGLVNKLNKVRGKVDGLTGGSRSPLKVKTAQQIKNKWKKGGMTAGGGGEDHPHGPGGTDMSGSEGHHHGADGQDVPNKYVSGGGSGGGGRSGGKAKSGGGGKRRKAGVASSSSASGHSHGPGGVDIPNNKARGQGGGNRQAKKRRIAAAQQTRRTQQTNAGGYNLGANQNQVQKPNQQRRKKKQRGY